MNLELPMGDYKVQLKKNNYLEVNRDVSLSESNPMRNMEEILQLVLGAIQVTSGTPEVDVSINGKPNGKTPLSLTLPMGNYQLVIDQTQVCSG